MVNGVPVYAGDQMLVPSRLYHSVGSDWAMHHLAVQLPPEPMRQVYDAADSIVDSMGKKLEAHGAGCIKVFSPTMLSKLEEQEPDDDGATTTRSAIASASASASAKAGTTEVVNAAPGGLAAGTAVRCTDVHPVLLPAASVGTREAGARASNWAGATDAAQIPDVIAWPDVGAWYFRYRLSSTPQCSGGAAREAPPERQKKREIRKQRSAMRRKEDQEQEHSVDGDGDGESGTPSKRPRLN